MEEIGESSVDLFADRFIYDNESFPLRHSFSKGRDRRISLPMEGIGIMNMMCLPL